MSKIDHPVHYGGKDNPYEAIKIIEALDFNFHLGNALKYMVRHGKKDPNKVIEDLEKAQWYLAREIERRKENQSRMVKNKSHHYKVRSSTGKSWTK